MLYILSFIFNSGYPNKRDLLQSGYKVQVSSVDAKVHSIVNDHKGGSANGCEGSLLRSRFLGRHATLPQKEIALRDGPKNGCEGD